jgi:hypothetical protein
VDLGHSYIALLESASKFKRSIMITGFMKIREERKAGDEFTVDAYLLFRHAMARMYARIEFQYVENGNFTVMT